MSALPSSAHLPRLSAPRLRRRAATRLGATKVVAVNNSKGGSTSKQAADDSQPATPAKRPMTRKRMIDSLLRQSADKLLASAAAAAAKSAKGSGGKQAKQPPPPSSKGSILPVGGAEEVLDLSGLLPSPPGPASVGAAVQARAARGSSVAPEREAPSAAAPVLRETWSYDTEDDVVKVSTEAAPQARRRRGGAPPREALVPPELAALLSRFEGGADGEDGVIYVDKEFDEEEQEDEEDEDGEWDVDAAEAGLEPQVRGKTALQRVDVKDVDEIIDALGGLDIRSLDKESQAILQEEYQRKLKVTDVRVAMPFTNH
jgi:hypothetical protein